MTEPTPPAAGVPMPGSGAENGVPAQPITLRVGEHGVSATGSLYERIGGARRSTGSSGASTRVSSRTR
ncbi:hypothetical protein P9139_10145 [Curtobacterium flaccumfaciens]|nr:hypothetical protein P9139_10145 [Curtobacterium flaccumfaciens]